MGLFSSNKSSASNVTNNIDRRVVADGGSIGFSGDNSTLVVTDGGIVSRALDSIDLNNATNAQGFDSLLGFAKSILDGGEGLIGQTQKAVADAYGQAQADKSGSFDQRTIVILAIAAAAVVIFVARKGKA